MKNKCWSRLLALLLCLCMLFSGSVLAEEVVGAIAEAVVDAADAPVVEEVAVEAAEEAAPIELIPLAAPEVIPQAGWEQGENNALIIPCNAEEITFKWTAVEGAASYRVETAHISEEGKPENVQEIDVVSETGIALPAASYQDGWYAIAVVAEAEDGRSSAGMQVFCLQAVAEEPAEDDEEVAEDVDVSEEATALTIIQQPQSVTVAAGQTATVSVQAIGDGLKYEWYIRNANASSYSKSSITTNTYSVVMDESRNGRRLICYVSDKYGNKIQCNTVQIKMGTKLRITQQPQSVTVVNGQKATVSVQAVGDGLTYAWFASDVGDNGVFYQSSTIKTSSYGVVMNNTRAGRKVYCKVTDKYGISVTSEVATLNCAPAITILTQPTNVTVAEGEKATVSVVARGEGLKYEWYTREASATKYYKSSITGSSYSVVMNAARNGRRLICYVSDKYGQKVQCNTVMIKMITPLRILQQPQNVTVAEGEKAVVSVVAQGDGLTYAWYIKDAGAGSYSKSSITSATYSVEMNAARSGRRLICYVYDKYGNRVQSNTVIIRMKTPLEILSQPQSVTVAEGEKAVVRVDARGDGLTYAWYASDTGDNGVYYQSATIKTNAYGVVMNATRDGRKVYCVVTDEYGDSVRSDVAVLSMVPSAEPDVELDQTEIYAFGMSTSTAKISWDKVENAEGYYVFRSKEEYGTYKKIATINSGSTNEYLDTGLERNTLYYYKVQAFANGGSAVSPMSDNDFVWTYLVDTPEITGVTSPEEGKVRIDWTPVEFADGYILERSESTFDEESETMLEFEIAGNRTYYIDTNIENGTTYFYRVSAYVDLEEWPEYGYPSDEIAFTTSANNPVKYRALLIGNTYPGTVNALSGPDNDVNGMYNMLSRQNETPYVVSCSYNASATSILNNIGYAFTGADFNDVSLFYYSGHGTSDGSLCGTSGYVSVSQLRSKLDEIPGKKIVILDSCYSGAHINKAFGDGEVDYTAFNDAVVSAFAAKNRANLAANDYVVLTACSKTETSVSVGIEQEDGSHFWFGALTYGVTKGSGFEMFNWTNCTPMADYYGDYNGKITLGETYDYAVDQVVNFLECEQNTQYYGDTDFVLWKY